MIKLSAAHSRVIFIITAASAQIITATCDVVLLVADDFEEVVELALLRATEASRTVTPLNPSVDKLVTMISVLAVRVSASADAVVPDIVTR